ncbi:hypothetical protein ACVGVM_07280 [Pseudonocardia bannensis]|uniref:DUF8017 domain-containing protein n=1 Tax=Pseudonocardia bannensis TaxID=630973 RepID=A0A848DK48_9PSEU|nr:hypothetical protein [Pseudonocardia bannensis]NMH92923.1 hypothetical protein [Pseudonocardia bannensis]
MTTPGGRPPESDGDAPDVQDRPEPSTDREPSGPLDQEPAGPTAAERAPAERASPLADPVAPADPTTVGLVPDAAATPPADRSGLTQWVPTDGGWGPPWAPPAAQPYPNQAPPVHQPGAADWSAPRYPGQQWPPTQQYPGQQWPPTHQYPAQPAAAAAPRLGTPGAPAAWGGQQWAGPAGPPTWAGPPTSWGPPASPPPGRQRGKIAALLTVGAVVLAGLGLGVFLLVRGTGSVTPSNFQAVRTSYLEYSVPPDWTAAPPGQMSSLPVLGVSFDGIVDGPEYRCDGATYLRGTVSSGLLTGPGTETAPETVARTFARELGTVYYTALRPPEVRVSAPRTVAVSGVTGWVVEATARTPADDGCLAIEGTVLVLALPTTAPDGAAATALLVVNGDVAGGPVTPPSPTRETLEQILGSARLPGI